MGWFLIAKLFSVLISLVCLGRLFETERDLAILLLLQQIYILLRNQDQPVRAMRIEKFPLAVRRLVVRINPSFCKSVERIHAVISA